MEAGGPGLATYTHGHHESVLRSHSWRTASNSAGYLIPHIRPNMHILDVGCGPGTITCDFASLVPEGRALGIDNAQDVIDKAREVAESRGVKNVGFDAGDVTKLPFADKTFDVVHAHQVLQHVGDPVQVLQEMRRVTKDGGIVAARSVDFASMTWFPENEGMTDWLALHLRIARSLNGDPTAGRQLLSWALKALFPKANVTSTASTWCYNTSEERAWWSGLWSERILASSFATNAVEKGLASDEELRRMSEAWKTWGESEDGWFAVLSGEILCRV